MAHVDVWTIALNQPLPSYDRAILSDTERERAARFRFEDDRVRWLRAHAALRTILGAELGIRPQDLEFTIGVHGKPALANQPACQFNLSHSGEYALIAVSEAAVGADIERIRDKVDMAALLRRLSETDLPDTTPALYSRWTQREAKSKAAGGELFAAPRPDIYALDIPAPEGYAASIACVGSMPTVRSR